MKLGDFYRLLDGVPHCLILGAPIPAESLCRFYFLTFRFIPHHSNLILILLNILYFLCPFFSTFLAIIMATATLPPLIAHKPELKLVQATIEDVQVITSV
jgi:hypothetical protein